MKRIAMGLLGLMLAIQLSGCGYNQIQSLDEQVTGNWHEIEVQLQRRADLIPNLVNVVRSYAKHEQKVFKDVADARARLSGAVQTRDPGQVRAAEGEFNSALSRLLVVAENYPQLKADQQYTRLMDELAGTENRIAVARRDYNETVRSLNTLIRQFPTNITAGVIQAKPRDYYEAPAESQSAPKVEMDPDTP